MKSFRFMFPRPALLGLTFLCSLATFSSLSAETAAFWRLEEGPEGSPVETGERDATIGEDAVVDISGNENHLRTWDTDTAPLYVTDVPFDPVPQSGEANDLALSFEPGREVYTDGKTLDSHQFDSWTIEISFKADRVDLYQIIVGKDGNPLDAPSPVFMKILAHNEHLELGLVDGQGTFQTVLSDAPVVPGEWYSVAATATEWELSLWIKGPDDSDYVLQGFFPADIEGAFLNTAEDFDRNWSVGRGMWGGNPADYFQGTVDEVRISDTALQPSEFLGTAGSDISSEHTLAHWRFEEGAADERVIAPEPAVGVDVVFDESGNENDMRAANEDSAPTYVGDVPFATVPQTGGDNHLALSFTPNRDIYTHEQPINSLEFDELTIEASFKANTPEGWQVIVGKDGHPLLPGEPQGGALHAAPPFMLKTTGDGDNIGRLEAGLVDSDRQFHSILSDQPLVAGEWYSAAITATATEFSYYLKSPGDTDYVLQGTAPIQGAFVGPDGFNEPEEYSRAWTIGRGMWTGGITDWFNGVVDEVRVSTVALDPSQFLAAGDGSPPFDPAALEIRPVIVERTENGSPRDFLAVETWDVESGTLQLQRSPGLGEWQDTPFTSEVIEPLDGSRDRLRLTSEIAVDEHSKYFLRVSVEE